MKILFLAPHPFYQERGTPIAVDLLLRALAERGDEVDVLTYHEGQDRAYDGRVRIHRIAPPPGCRGIRPGLSAKKLISDVYMYSVAMRMARENKYDVVHAVEESIFMARRIKRRFGIPYIVDMDSSMPLQIVDGLPILRFALPAMQWFERNAVRDSLAVAAVCDALASLANEYGAKKTFVLRDVPLLDQCPSTSPPPGFRKELGLEGTCLLYLGNLVQYQGIDLLLKSFALMPKESGANLVIVGGAQKHIKKYCSLANDLGISQRTHFTGPRPPAHMASLMADADILVSPRTHGTNTPMKIYSYMASGKAILATDLPTHTQVLDSTTARLAAPDPQSFAQAMTELIGDREQRDRLGRQAALTVEEKYSMRVFKQTVNELYGWIEALLPTSRFADPSKEGNPPHQLRGHPSQEGM